MAHASPIDPALLAAALREVAGIEVDPSTDAGAIEASRHVRRLMGDKRSLRRLLEVVARLELKTAGVDDKGELAFGPVVTCSGTFPDLATAAPPIGSEEFERYIDDLVSANEQDSATTASTASISEPICR